MSTILHLVLLTRSTKYCEIIWPPQVTAFKHLAFPMPRLNIDWFYGLIEIPSLHHWHCFSPCPRGGEEQLTKFNMCHCCSRSNEPSSIASCASICPWVIHGGSFDVQKHSRGKLLAAVSNLFPGNISRGVSGCITVDTDWFRFVEGLYAGVHRVDNRSNCWKGNQSISCLTCEPAWVPKVTISLTQTYFCIPYTKSRI